MLPLHVLLFALTALESGAAAIGPGVAAEEVATDPGTAIDFNADIRPILSGACFRCHGPDAAARKKGLRLDTREGAIAELKSGRRAIVPGDTKASALIERINSDDPDEVMPPPELHMALTPRERDVLARWIDAGAEYQPHWAFVAPRRADPPPVHDAAWNADPIDRFIWSNATQAGIRVAPEADRETLLRRVTLTLTGLPPTIAEMDAFKADTDPRAYERTVDRLLASARYAERMAADWLDVARYADTFGYQSDWECRVWPWRDWLIASFSRNQPYDEFVRDQIAGDLVAGATTEQRLATTFNRLHRQTNEGGSIDEEFRREYISDRVHTYGTAFLGLTVECARCHDHKYDPIPQKDYYSLGAFFGSIDETGTYPYSTGATPRPAMRLVSPAQQAELERLGAAIENAQEAARAARSSTASRTGGTLDDSLASKIARPIRDFPLEGQIEGPIGRATLLDGDTGPTLPDVPQFRRSDPLSLVFWMRCPDAKSRATVLHTSTFTIEADEQGYQVMLKDGRLCWEIVHLWPGSAAAIRTVEPFPLGRWVQVSVTYDGSSRASGLSVYLDGERARTEIVRDHLDGPATVRTLQVGFRSRDLGFKQGAVAGLRLFDVELSALEVAEQFRPGAIGEEVAAAAKGGPSPELVELVSARSDVASKSAVEALHDARVKYQQLLESIPEIMVMEESAHPRQSFVLKRGQYDQPDLGQPVGPDRALESILPFDAALPHNRLGLARWTTDPRNPLTSRVAVNRLWAICFGRGLVPTLENLGLQSEPPLHRELLDTLAADFVASGWDVKAMLRRIVRSAAFRQASAANPEAMSKDPQNVYIARGPSSRLSAEMLRDQALAASGLLVEKIGGPSVKPYQPAGLWEEAGASAQNAYVVDTGAAAHRRSLYTFRKRTAPPPNMLAFDAGSREQCQARRLPTNTPLQALVLLNDSVFVECARALVARVTREDADPEARTVRAFRLLAGRPPRPAEAAALRALYEKMAAQYKIDAAAATAVGGTVDPELAAMTIVCSTVMASDAVVTCR